MGKSGRAQQAEEENADLRQKKLQESVFSILGLNWCKLPSIY